VCFENSVLRRISGLKREEYVKKSHNEEPHNLKPLPEIMKVIKEYEMDVTCRTYDRNEKCIQSYGLKA
jgi:hypothetical protein